MTAPLTLTRGDVQAASAVLTASAAALEARGEALWPAESLTPDRLARHYPPESWRVAWQGGQGVACMALLDADPPFWPDDEPGTALYLHKLAVHPQAQGRGLAARLLDAAVAEVRARQRLFLKLDTATARPKLRALYETYGFQPLGKRTVFGYDVTLYTLPME